MDRWPSRPVNRLVLAHLWKALSSSLPPSCLFHMGTTFASSVERLLHMSFTWMKDVKATSVLVAVSISANNVFKEPTSFRPMAGSAVTMLIVWLHSHPSFLRCEAQE